MCKVESRGLPCFELEAEPPEAAFAEAAVEDATVISEDDDGEEAGGLVTGSPAQNPSSPLSSEDE